MEQLVVARLCILWFVLPSLHSELPVVPQEGVMEENEPKHG